MYQKCYYKNILISFDDLSYARTRLDTKVEGVVNNTETESSRGFYE